MKYRIIEVSAGSHYWYKVQHKHLFWWRDEKDSQVDRLGGYFEYTKTFRKLEDAEGYIRAQQKPVEKIIKVYE